LQIKGSTFHGRWSFDAALLDWTWTRWYDAKKRTIGKHRKNSDRTIYTFVTLNFSRRDVAWTDLDTGMLDKLGCKSHDLHDRRVYPRRLHFSVDNSVVCFRPRQPDTPQGGQRTQDCQSRIPPRLTNQIHDFLDGRRRLILNIQLHSPDRGKGCSGTLWQRKELTDEEDRPILELHARYGRKWSLIARQLPDPEANQIKNHIFLK
jgi:hypothetical protein